MRDAIARFRIDTLGTPDAAVGWAATFYLGHILFQGKIALSELFAFGAIFCFGYAVARGRLRPTFHILYYPLLVYGVVSTISAMGADRRIHSAGEAMLWFKMAIFPVAVTLMRELPRMRRLALRLQIVFAVVIAGWGLAEFVFADRRDLEHRITGPSPHVMTFSGLLLPLALLLLLLWIHRRTWWLFGAMLTVNLVLLLTFTRSVWLGWGAAVLVLAMLTRAPWRAFILPAALWFLILMPLPLFGRLMSTFDPSQSSNFDRIRMLEAGIEMIKDQPLLGVGPANVKEVYPLYKRHDAPRSRPPHLHNNVVQLWAERGILGLAAYVMLMVLFLRECALAWNAHSRAPAGDSAGGGDSGPAPWISGGAGDTSRVWAESGVAVCVSLAVAGLFEFNFGDTEVFYLMLDLFAVLVVTMESGRTQRQPTNEPPGVLVPAHA